MDDFVLNKVRSLSWKVYTRWPTLNGDSFRMARGVQDAIEDDPFFFKRQYKTEILVCRVKHRFGICSWAWGKEHAVLKLTMNQGTLYIDINNDAYDEALPKRTRITRLYIEESLPSCLRVTNNRPEKTYWLRDVFLAKLFDKIGYKLNLWD